MKDCSSFSSAMRGVFGQLRKEAPISFSGKNGEKMLESLGESLQSTLVLALATSAALIAAHNEVNKVGKIKIGRRSSVSSGRRS